MAEAGGTSGPRERRRVGALLNSYYRIEGVGEESQRGPSTQPVENDVNHQAFDPARYFDSMVASGQLGEVLKRKSDLESEVQSLDGDMQKLVYENYNKFIRATDVIKQMKFTIEGLSPDLQVLQGHVCSITEYQHRVEDRVSTRAGRIEGLLKQQQLCRKLQVLFSLPAKLQRCLDRGAYGQAVEAYCCCAEFLRKYREMPTFQKVLEEVELQMGRIRSALESRLHSAELSVDEAVNSSVTLLDLGEDQTGVARKYFSGRTSMLRQCLEQCFMEDTGVPAEPSAAGLPKDQEELQRPESMRLRAACCRAAELYVPHLCDAVEGFQKLQEGRSEARCGAMDESMLPTFVEARVQELCQQISALVDRNCPPTRVLVSCIHLVRDSLRRLHSWLPPLLTKLFMTFLSRTAADAMRALFDAAALRLISDLSGLHGTCKRLQESKNSGLDDVLEEIGGTEQSLIMHAFHALMGCQPLLNLLGSDRPSCLQFMRGLHEQLASFFFAFVAVCRAYIGIEPVDVRGQDPCLPGASPAMTPVELQDVTQLDWSGLFGLALVRIGRHLEVKTIAKAWAVARDLFPANDALAAELVPHPGVIEATRRAAQATITHYALVSGQRLAHFFRNSVQTRNWMTVREPRDPRKVVEMVLKEVHAFDAQLAGILGDPRKLREAGHQRRTLNRCKNSVELETLRSAERLWAKKRPVFAPIPFNRNQAIVGILLIAFKALYEYMREETFAKFGLQQIQVDTAFLKEVVRDFVEAEDASLLDSLLDEVVASASQRCDDPVLMDTNEVEKLCDEKKRKTGFQV